MEVSAPPQGISELSKIVSERLATASGDQARALIRVLVSVQAWKRRRSFPDNDLVDALGGLLKSASLQADSLQELCLAADRASLYNETASIPGRLRRLSLDSIRFATLIGVAGSILFAFLIIVFFYLVQSQIDRYATLPRGPVLALVISGYLGSVCSMVASVESARDDLNLDPSVVLLSAMLRPLLGALFALFLYGILASGLIRISNWELPKSDCVAVAWTTWVIGFVAGFGGERVVPDVVRRASDLFGKSAK